MLNLFSKWIGEQPTRTDARSPPTLPQNRPRVLTPSPSHESLSKSAASTTVNSAFFQKLPFEIRHKIIRHAFGDETIHIDLYFDFPMKPLSERQPNHTQRNSSARVPPPGPQWGLAKVQKKQWQWLSGVCYCRTHDVAPNRVDDLYYSDTVSPPAMTDCCETFHTSLGVRPVGVMGWLLSCRQAYSEGIDVLYATNTMHMSGNHLFQQAQERRYGPGTMHMSGELLPRLLPNVLLPKRLASITSLIIRWTCHPWGSYYGSDFYSLLSFNNLLTDLPRIFPPLKKLHLSLEGKMIDPHVERSLFRTYIESKILNPVDDMVRTLGPQMQEFHLAISAQLYIAMKYPMGSLGEQTPEERHKWLRTWREVPKYASDFPQRDSHLEGYTIRIGQLDLLAIRSFIPEVDDDF